MNLATRLFLLLAVLVFTTGCGAQASSTKTTEIDDLFTFDEDGYAVVRGQVTGDWTCSTVDGRLRATLNVEVPVVVDGVAAGLDLMFVLTFDTRLASNLTPYTTLRDYLAAHPDSSTFDAFPIFETVDVTFLKGDWDFEAAAIRQVDPAGEQPASLAGIDGVLSINMFSRGILEGTISGSHWGDDVVDWTLAMPVTVQGIPASIRLPLRSTAATQVIAGDNTVPMDIYHPGGHVRVEFKRTGNTLEATRFIELR